ncbi:MAG: hypothetical protein JOY54_14745 [Acidobacteriaceae bacterium]|nr:hypothetical protein [Acidobacteriaceae bacterium]
MAELRVAIMQDKANWEQRAVDTVDAITSHLRHPFLCGVSGDSGERDGSRLQVQEEQNVVGDQVSPGEHFDREEVDARLDRHAGANEVRPVHLLAALGSRRNTKSA